MHTKKCWWHCIFIHVTVYLQQIMATNIGLTVSWPGLRQGFEVLTYVYINTNVCIYIYFFVAFVRVSGSVFLSLVCH